MANSNKKSSKTSSKSKITAAKPAATRSAPGASRTHSTVEGKPVVGARTITSQAIAEAAYYLWLERGGDQISNWVEAERRLQTHFARA